MNNSINMTNERLEKIKLHESYGYKTVHEFTEVTVMEKKGEFVKIDSDGKVIPFKPLFT